MNLAKLWNNICINNFRFVKSSNIKYKRFLKLAIQIIPFFNPHSSAFRTEIESMFLANPTITSGK